MLIIVLFVLVVTLFFAAGMFLSSVLRPNNPGIEKNKSYESGEEPVGNAWNKFNSRFYTVAVLFLLFEVEVVFFFPWATVFGNREIINLAGYTWLWISLSEMALFAGLLALGLAYIWKNGHLDWNNPGENTISFFKSPVPDEIYKQVNEKYTNKTSVKKDNS